MTDLQNFRARLPLVGKVIEKMFNGDTDEDDTGIDFILIASKVEGKERVSATLTNTVHHQLILGLMLKALAEGESKFSPVTDTPVGHA